MVHPLFGLFAEPASTLLVTAHQATSRRLRRWPMSTASLRSASEPPAAAGSEISVDREPFISAPLCELRRTWAESLEATLHGEVTA